MDLVSALKIAFLEKKKIRRPKYQTGQWFTVEEVGPKHLVCFDQKKRFVKFKMESITATDWEIL